MTERYIAIEHNTGYIWGDAVAATPEEACAVIAQRADPTRPLPDWERVPPIRDTDGGYHLFVVPEGFPEIIDGTDPHMIERVDQECRHIGDYKPVVGEVE